MGPSLSALLSLCHKPFQNVRLLSSKPDHPIEQKKRSIGGECHAAVRISLRQEFSRGVGFIIAVCRVRPCFNTVSPPVCRWAAAHRDAVRGVEGRQDRRRVPATRPPTISPPPLGSHAVGPAGQRLSEKYWGADDQPKAEYVIRIVECTL